MARTAFRVQLAVDGPVSYTVPAGKQAVFKAFSQSTGANSVNVVIDGVTGPALQANAGLPLEAGPLTAEAGEVIGITGAAAQTAFIGGFLYDVS